MTSAAGPTIQGSGAHIAAKHPTFLTRTPQNLPLQNLRVQLKSHTSPSRRQSQTTVSPIESDHFSATKSQRFGRVFNPLPAHRPWPPSEARLEPQQTTTMADEQKPSPAPAAAEGAEGDAGPSKKALKKAEAKAKKEAEKAKRAAEREAAQAAAKSKEDSEDKAKDNYGDRHLAKLEGADVSLRKYADSHLGQKVQLRAWVQNSRMQGAKMCFVELREREDWTVQAVIAAHPDGEPVSKQMVKWVGAIGLESYVGVEATVQKPLEPVKSCKVANYELHITKMYCLARGPEMLGLTMGASNAAIVRDAEDEGIEAKVAGLSVSDGAPAAPALGATLKTHLDNIVMHKRAPVQQAIYTVRRKVRKLFAEYLEDNGFQSFEPPCLIGAASEGGGNVFELKYFEKHAFLAQSPQFYKQMEIAGGVERVYGVGPVFRAEKSNTPRHMTEVRIVLIFETHESFV